jgi:DNA-binding LytR/AlgR family response regulator
MQISIVEDQKVQRELLELYLQELGYSNFKSYENAEEFLNDSTSPTPDILILDINLSGLINGISLSGDHIDNQPVQVVFTTSQTDPSVLKQAIDTKPTDLLIKPISVEQLHASLLMAEAKVSSVSDVTSEKLMVKDTFLVYKDGHMFERSALSDLQRIESEGNYVTLHFSNKRVTLKITLSEVESRMPNPQFVRINRSVIVNRECVSSFNSKRVVMISGEEIAVSKSIASDILNRLVQ